MLCCRRREGEKMIQEQSRIEGGMRKQRKRAHDGKNDQPLNAD